MENQEQNVKPVSQFPTADEAAQKAEENFRKRMRAIISEAIDTGLNVIDVEVTHIRPSVVSALIEELSQQGFNVSQFNTHYMNKGRNSNRLLIKY